MANEQAAMAELAENLWNNYLKHRVKEAMNGCVITRRAMCKTAPNGTTMGVQFPFETATINLPYVSLCANTAVNSQVTVAFIGGSATNAVVIQNGTFTL